MGRPRRSDQTSRTLRLEIERGQFRGVEVLPGERQLATLLQVSRTTLRRALAELIDEGLLSQRHGMGTYVNAAAVETMVRPVAIPVVFYGLNGRIQRLVELSRGQDAASAEDIMRFGIDRDEDVFRLSQVAFVRGRPDAVECWSAPSRFLPTPSAIGCSLPAAVADCGHPPVRKLQRLRMAVLGADEAAHLGTSPNEIGIRLDEAFFLADGACCIVNRALYRAETFDAVYAMAVTETGVSRP